MSDVKSVTIPEECRYWGYSVLYREQTEVEKVYSGYYIPDEYGDVQVNGIKYATVTNGGINFGTNQIYIYEGTSKPTNDPNVKTKVVDGIWFKRNPNNTCSSDIEIDINNGGKACENCTNHVRKVLEAMQKVSGDLETYLPYITEVKDHWYRDVYFVDPNYSNSTPHGEIVKLVKSDTAYEEITNERWTLYETYEDGDKEGEFKLYKYIPPDENSNEEDYKNHDCYGELYDGTQQEAEEEGIAVIKKPVTENMDDLKDGDKYWNAYELDEKTNTLWERAYTDDSVTEEVKDYTSKNAVSDELKKSYTRALKRLYIWKHMYSNIAQMEDGRRGVTNEKIKEMFLNNYYYQYDGTPVTANKIFSIKSSLYGRGSDLTDGGRSVFDGYKGSKLVDRYEGGENEGQPYGAVPESLFNKRVNFLNTGGGDESDADSYTASISDTQEVWSNTIGDFVAHPKITTDSLVAFSMLENTHTLDADFIYKDFKELIVELGYFTKEELTDSKRIFEWVVPEIESYGWPKRFADKLENEYGTFIHSKTKYEELEKESDSQKIQNVSTSSTSGSATTGTPSTTTTSTTTEESEEDDIDMDLFGVINEGGSDIYRSYTYKGFEGNESVVSPATGVLLKSGSHDRRNAETGEKEEVGFALIKVLDEESYKSLKASKAPSLDDSKKPKVEQDGNTYKFSELSGTNKDVYAYKLFKDGYQIAGVAGNLILIDGFDCSGSISSDGLYKPRKIYESEDKETSKRLKAQEEARKTAKTNLGKVVDGDNDGVKDDVIKEGTILGTVREDTYIRVIMRRQDDEIEEDVERFFRLDDEDNIDRNLEHFMYWQAMEPEGFFYNLPGNVKLTDKWGKEARRDSEKDKYGHEYAVFDDPKHLKSLAPGILLQGDGGQAGIDAFKRVTGRDVGDSYGSWITGTELLDIYHIMLLNSRNTLKTCIGNTKLEGSQIYALIDVLWAGSAHFTDSELCKKIKNGERPTIDDFIETVNYAKRESFYEDLKRRRVFDYYIFTQGKYPANMRSGYSDIKDVTQYYQFTSSEPFQDLMKDTDSAYKVDF